MIHLLLIHQAFVGPTEPGGTRHFELARHVVARGHTVTVIASDRNYLTGRRRMPAGPARSRYSDSAGIHVVRLRTHASLHRSFVQRILLFIGFMISSFWMALRQKGVSVVMGTSPPIFQAFSAWAVAALKHRPFLLEIRDLWPTFAVGMGVLKNPILIRISLMLERFLYRRATHLVVNSPAYRDHIVARGVAANRISVIANGVEPSHFKPEATGDSVRREWRLNGEFVVTYAGALGQANDVSTLLRAAARLRDHEDVRFLVVGDGKERENLTREARILGLQSVTFAGVRPKEEMPEILAASDVCVAILQNITQFKTTYPNKVFDYMAAGRPTILAIDGVIRDVIENSGGGIFVPPGDDAALAQAIRTLHADRRLCGVMGKAAREYVAKHFDRAVQAEAFVSLLEKVAAANAA